MRLLWPEHMPTTPYDSSEARGRAVAEPHQPSSHHRRIPHRGTRMALYGLRNGS
jgi:hypothetical protein